jgi:hypothetical protein
MTVSLNKPAANAKTVEAIKNSTSHAKLVPT